MNGGKVIFRIIKVSAPAVIIALLLYFMQGGKDVLTGLYFIFPLIYSVQGILAEKRFWIDAIGFGLSSVSFLVFVKLFYHMGSCIELAAIYLALGTLAAAVKLLIITRKKDN